MRFLGLFLILVSCAGLGYPNRNRFAQSACVNHVVFMGFSILTPRIPLNFNERITHPPVAVDGEGTLLIATNRRFFVWKIGNENARDLNLQAASGLLVRSLSGTDSTDAAYAAFTPQQGQACYLVDLRDGLNALRGPFGDSDQWPQLLQVHPHAPYAVHVEASPKEFSYGVVTRPFGEGVPSFHRMETLMRLQGSSRFEGVFFGLEDLYAFIEFAPLHPKVLRVVDLQEENAYAAIEQQLPPNDQSAVPPRLIGSPERNLFAVVSTEVLGFHPENNRPRSVHRIRLYQVNVDFSLELRLLREWEYGVLEPGGSPPAVAFAPGGILLIGEPNGVLKSWRITDEFIEYQGLGPPPLLFEWTDAHGRLSGADSTISAIAVTRGGDLIASGANDGSVALWQNPLASPLELLRRTHTARGRLIQYQGRIVDLQFIESGRPKPERHLVVTIQRKPGLFEGPLGYDIYALPIDASECAGNPIP